MKVQDPMRGLTEGQGDDATDDSRTQLTIQGRTRGIALDDDDIDNCEDDDIEREID